MLTPRRGVGAFLLVALAAGVGWFASSEPEVRLQAEDQQDQQELAEIQRRLRELTRAQDQLAEKMRPRSLEEIEEPSPTPSSPLTGRIDAAAQSQAQQETLAAWFYDLPVDDDWSLTAERELQSVLGAIEGTQLSADCAAEACRLELAFVSEDDRDNTMPQVPLLLPWSGEGFVAPLDDAGLEVVVYLAREGRTLPRASGVGG